MRRVSPALTGLQVGGELRRAPFTTDCAEVDRLSVQGRGPGAEARRGYFYEKPSILLS